MAVTYVVAAFVVLQLADLAAGAFDVPGWFEPMIWVVAGLGFPIALVIAWAFELTPEGVRRTAEAEPEEQTGESTTYRWIGLALVVLLAGGVWYAISGDGGEPSNQTIAAADTAQTTRGLNAELDAVSSDYADRLALLAGIYSDG